MSLESPYWPPYPIADATDPKTRRCSKSILLRELPVFLMRCHLCATGGPRPQVRCHFQIDLPQDLFGYARVQGGMTRPAQEQMEPSTLQLAFRTALVLAFVVAPLIWLAMTLSYRLQF